MIEYPEALVLSHQLKQRYLNQTILDVEVNAFPHPKLFDSDIFV